MSIHKSKKTGNDKSLCAILAPKNKPLVGDGYPVPAHGRRYVVFLAGNGINASMPEEARRLGKGYALLTEEQLPTKILRRKHRLLRPLHLDDEAVAPEVHVTLSLADLPAIQQKIREANTSEARQARRQREQKIRADMREFLAPKACQHPYEWTVTLTTGPLNNFGRCGTCETCRAAGIEVEPATMTAFTNAVNLLDRAGDKIKILSSGPPSTPLAALVEAADKRRRDNWDPFELTTARTAAGSPLPTKTPRPKGGDGAAHPHKGYCTCGYKKQVFNTKSRRWGIAWFSWGRCDWCIEQRRLEKYQEAETGVKKSEAAGVRDFFVSDPFFSKPRVYQKKIKRTGMPDRTLPEWYGWVPGEKGPRPLCADKKASLAILKELFTKAGIVAEIDGDALVRGIRDAGGGVATAHLPNGSRIVFADRPIDGVASRKVCAADLLAAVKDTLAKCEPRGQGRPIMTFSGTWKPEKPEPKGKKEGGNIFEVGPVCTWTMAEIEVLCRELAVVILPCAAVGKIKHRIEFQCRDARQEKELLRRLSGPSPNETALVLLR